MVGSAPSGGHTYEDELVDIELDNELDDAGEDEAGRQASEDIELHLGEAGRNWERPPAPALDQRTDSLSAKLLLCTGRLSCMPWVADTSGVRRSIPAAGCRLLYWPA